jgi:hypothetical protein
LGSQGAFSKKLEGFLIEMYLREKALFWGAFAAEQLLKQEGPNPESEGTGESVKGPA